MFFIYISIGLLISYTILKYFNSKLNIKKFDFKKDYSFFIKSIEFNENGNIVELNRYTKYYYKQQYTEFNLDSKYNYLIINYIYNNKEYKFYSENNALSFPIYSKEQIKNYVYINKITKAIIIIDYREYNILNIILQYLGPNYNFYVDLGIKLSIKKILTHEFLKKNMSMTLSDHVFNNKDYIIKFYDNFNNEYLIDDYLNWNPELKL